MAGDLSTCPKLSGMETFSGSLDSLGVVVVAISFLPVYIVLFVKFVADARVQIL